MRAALRHARLQAERQAVAIAIPLDPSPELAKVDRRLAELRRDRTELASGKGRYAGTPEGDAARRLIHAREHYLDAQRHAEASDGWRDRRHWRKEAAQWADQESTAETVYVATVGPMVTQLDQAISHLEDRRDELHTDCHERTAWLAEHPEAARRLRSLDREINPLPELPEIQALGQHHAANLRHGTDIHPPGHGRGPELDFGP